MKASFHITKHIREEKIRFKKKKALQKPAGNMEFDQAKKVKKMRSINEEI